MKQPAQSARAFKQEVTEQNQQDEESVRIGANAKAEEVAENPIGMTEGNLAEAKVRRDDDIFFVLIQNSPFGIFLVDADFRLQQVSQGARRVFENIHPLHGRDFAEVLRTVWPEPFASEAIGRFRHTLDTGEPYASPSTVEQRADIGRVEAYDWRIARINLPDGRYGVVCYFYDLSERQRWETILRTSEERLRLATEAAELGIWTWQPDGDVAIWENDRPYEIFGIPSTEPSITAARFKTEFLHPEDLETFEIAFTRTVHERAPLLCECRIRRRDGELRWVEFTGRVVDGEENLRIIGTVQDISDRKEAAEAIRLSEAKQRFTVRLADALRPLSDPIEVQAEASRLLGEHLAANRVVYFEISESEYVIERDYTAGVQPLSGRYALASFGPSLLAMLLGGRTVVEAEATTEPNRSPREQAAFAAIEVRGHVDVPLVKGGRFVAGMTVHVSEPRKWTLEEVALIEDTAERTWAAVERARAEAALRQSEERSAFVRRSSGVGFWYCDLPFDVLQWDDLVKAHFHLPPDASVTIKTFYDRIHPDDRELTRQAIEQSIAGHTPYDVDYRTVDPNTGAVNWVRAIGRTFYGADGAPVSFDGVTLDVSERKRAEENLRRSQQQLEAVLLSIDDGLVVLDCDARCIFVSEQAARMVGVAPQDMVGVVMWDLVPQLKGTRFDEAYHRAITSGKPVHFEEFYPETINKWLECHFYPSVDGLTVYFREVTDRKLREAERAISERLLAEERDKLRFMADSLPQKIFTATPDGSRNYFNRQWLEFSGLSHEKLEGLGWVDLVHPDDRKSLLDEWARSIKAEEPFYFEYRLRNRDGAYRWHLSRAYPKRDELGAVTIWIGSSTDVHEARKVEALQREKLEREVGIRTEELMRSNEQLQGFTYSVAHDLRQQIRGVSLNSAVLLRDAEGSLNDECKRTLELLTNNAKRLSLLVDDLLTYARLGRQEPKRVALDLSQMAREVAAYLRQSGRCGPQIKIKVARGLTTHGDPAMIRLVMENLMDNACKFSADAESPVVEIGRSGDYFFVRDNGIGFDMEFVGKLFQPFERLHKDSEYPGTGIGLANVKRIVEKHGGNVEAKGRSGEGATFFFNLGIGSSANGPPP